MKKISLHDYFYIFLGAFILAFGIYNIHSVCNIIEGGQLGLELMLQHFFKISPSITSFVFDFVFLIIGTFLFGNKFAFKTIYATICFSLSYRVLELFPPILPDLSNYLIIATVVGAIFVGVGCGLVIRHGAASGGDDSLALILSKITKLPLSISYMAFDFLILFLSLTYLSFSNFMYSSITSIISSFIIDAVAGKGCRRHRGRKRKKR